MMWNVFFVKIIFKYVRFRLWNVFFVKIIFKHVRARQITHIDGNCAYFDVCYGGNDVRDVKWMDMRTLTRALMNQACVE